MVALVALLVVFINKAIAAPNLRTLAKSCFILHDPAGKYEVSPEWEEPAKVMQGLEILPELTKRIRDTVTADHGNKSVLIVGDASSAYRYFLASLAVSGDPQFSKFAHLEIDLPKIVEGHTLLGQVQEYWQKNIGKPALGEDIIMYVSNLNSMIGLGASTAPPPAWRRCSRQTFRAAKCEASHSSIITTTRESAPTTIT